MILISDSEIYTERFKDTESEPNLHFYGIKGRKMKSRQASPLLFDHRQAGDAACRPCRLEIEAAGNAINV